jgi:hypothetical protein
MLRPAICAAVLLVSPPAALHAQPGAVEPAPTAPPVASGDDEDKSSATAVSLAMLGTGASIATLYASARTESGALATLGLCGFVFGPSFGHFYAGEGMRGLGHGAIRAGAVGVVFTGAVLTFSDCGFGGDCDGAGPPLMVGGALLGLGSVVYSMVDAAAAARRHNEASAQRRLILTPAPVIGPQRSTGFGVQLAAPL